MYCNAVEYVARKAKEQGVESCCDWDNQKSYLVDEKLNLIYIMRNMLLVGHAIRSTCGQSEAQFRSYETFPRAIVTKFTGAARSGGAG
jgi:hypothetical protein